MAFNHGDNQLDTCNDSETLRLKKTAFTRKSKLGAKRLVHIILHKLARSLQLEIDRYYAHIAQKPVSKQALSQARAQLNPEFIRGFADMTAEIVAQDKDVSTYQGMRLIAIDGSTLALENTPELKAAFGCSGKHEQAATARISIACDVFHHVIYDCRIDAYKTDERSLAYLHLERLRELGLAGSLLLFDRAYPGGDFIAELYEQGFPFLMRARKNWTNEVSAITGEGWIDLSAKRAGKTTPVRVIKVMLSTGEEEVLLTSLSEAQLPASRAGELYFARWQVETVYRLIKCRLELETFSGKTEVSVLQDFYGAIYLANMAAFVAAEADEEITQADREKALSHPRKASRNRTVAKLREKLFCMFLEPDKAVRNAMLRHIVAEISAYPVPVIPHRSERRNLSGRSTSSFNSKSLF